MYSLDKEDVPLVEQSEISLMRQMSRLFGPSLRRTTILLIGIWFCCAFSWAGFAMFLPKLMYRSNVVKSRSEVYSSMVF